MGNLNSFRRSLAKHPERMWFAKQTEKKRKQIALENDAKKKTETENLIAEASKLVQERMGEPTRPLADVLE